MPENEGRTFDPYHDVLVKLPQEGQRLLLSILSRNDPMDPRTSRKVKDVCQRYVKELEGFGLIPDYYAYALIYWASSQNPEAIKAALAKIGQQQQRPPDDGTQSFAEAVVNQLLDN
jgi:hypothetical protein